VRLIGRYEVESEIGRGAMGVVYLAHDPRVRRDLAVKTYLLPDGLPPERETEFRERFLREAQAAGALDHPAIVTIYDADEDPSAGTPFIAMEYVPGQTLRDLLLAEGPLSPERAIAMVSDLAEALHVAHAAGVIHRDIKPANILVREKDGAVKIADFGVARLAASELTQSGASLGSPAYMAPEQIRGVAVDGRSDLFALATILYEALSGRRPFDGEDLSALAYAVVHENVVPVTRLVPGLPPGLEPFFQRALAKAPGGRFPDGRAFATALREALESGGKPVPAAGDVEATVVADASPGGSQAAAAALEVMRVEGAALGRLTFRGLCRAGKIGSRLGRAGWREGNAAFRRLEPGRQRLAAGAVLLVAVLAILLGAWTLWATSYRASLILQVKNSYESATLTVQVDGETVYARGMEADRKQVKAFGKKLMAWGQEQFEKRIYISPGSHEIVVQVVPEGESRGHEERKTLELDPGESRRLKITAGGKFHSPLSVKLN
jgi:predicted Ser/Thr protein kinase